MPKKKTENTLVDDPDQPRSREGKVGTRARGRGCIGSALMSRRSIALQRCAPAAASPCLCSVCAAGVLADSGDILAWTDTQTPKGRRLISG